MLERRRPAARRRVGINPAIQQAMFFRLIAGALAAFTVVLLASYFYLAPLGDRSIRAVVPIVHEYLLAGQNNDVTRAHATYSSQALKNVSRDDVAFDLSRRDLFDGYRRLQLKTFLLKPGTTDMDPDTATVRGIVSYESRAPMILRAQLAFEGDLWRLDWIKLEPFDS